jgi:hypothetical protein
MYGEINELSLAGTHPEAKHPNGKLPEQIQVFHGDEFRSFTKDNQIGIHAQNKKCAGYVSLFIKRIVG